MNGSQIDHRSRDAPADKMPQPKIQSIWIQCSRTALSGITTGRTLERETQVSICR
jgi:hypothetical protein